MKKISMLSAILFISILSSDVTLADSKNSETISQSRYDKVCKWGFFNPPECKKRIVKSTSQNNNKLEKTNSDDVIKSSSRKTEKEFNQDCKWGIFNPPKCKGKDKRYKNDKLISKKSTTDERKIKNDRVLKSGDQNVALYTGTFDILDKEGDDQTTLIGIEHKNESLFRNTWLGKFSPTTGAFVTGKNSIYLYSGVEADYNLGPLSISPSFAPGYYEKGNGKDLGSVLEFKSAVSVGLNIFENSNIGYSYSHISNNDWGETNPGTDNQQVTFSRKF